MLTLEIGIEIEELEQRIAPDGGERCYHSLQNRPEEWLNS